MHPTQIDDDSAEPNDTLDTNEATHRGGGDRYMWTSWFQTAVEGISKDLCCALSRKVKNKDHIERSKTKCVVLSVRVGYISFILLEKMTRDESLEMERRRDEYILCRRG